MGKQKIWQTALYAVGASAAAWLFLRYLGPVFLPFGVGLVFALTAEPIISALQNRLKLPRWAASGVGVAAVYGALGLLVFVLCRLLCRELMGFVRALPSLAQSLAGPAQGLERRLLALAERFPDGVGQALRQGISDFFRSGAGLADKAYDWIFRFVSDVLKKVPDLALFLLTAVLSGFMLASELPELKSLWRKKAPPLWQSRAKSVLHRLKTTLGGWLKAQLKLMLISALILTTGFLILGVDYPLLFGMGIALIDALPVLGSGMVLIPWGLFLFLQGKSFLGTGLLCLYGAAALSRTALEPRLLGKQMGLDPLLTLVALYGGYRFLGIAGMLLFPIAAMLLKQFWNHMEKKIDF